MRDIKRIFVHCTAGSQKTTLKQLEQEFKNKGWTNPGYHYVVFPDGKIEQMLDENKVSNGVQGYNSTSINVAYVGGVDSKLKPIDNRTDAQKDSLITLLTILKEKYPNAHIMGHRDIWGKDEKKWLKWCPCFDAEVEYAHVGEPVMTPLLDVVEDVENEDEEITEHPSISKSDEPEEPKQTEEQPKEKLSWWKRFLTKWKRILKFLRILKKS